MTHSMHPLAQRSFALVATAAVLALGAAFATTAGSPARADISHPVRVDSPAVVRIVSAVTGQVICNQCNSDGSNIVFPLNGGVYQIALSGSGAFISPDGYLLTADHVVDIDHNPEIDQAFLTSAINEYAQHAGISTDQAQQEFQNAGNAITVQHQVQSQRAYLSTAYTGQLQNTAQVTSYAITRIVANSTPDKQDTAIVKIEAHDLPYLALAPANSVHLQDAVTALAFPGDADLGDFSSLLQPTASDTNTINGLLSLSANSGTISGQKTLADGTLVYETGGGIAAQGSSGGPIIDQMGRIIGFDDAGTSSDRVNFLIPSDVIAEYVQQAGVTSPPQGAFMTQWTKAASEFDATGACHWTNATRDLKALRDAYPQFGAVQPLIQQATPNATPAECPAPVNKGLLYGAIGGGIVVLALAGILGYLLVARRKRPAPALASATSSPYPTGYAANYPGAAYPSPYGATAPSLNSPPLSGAPQMLGPTDVTQQRPAPDAPLDIPVTPSAPATPSLPTATFAATPPPPITPGVPAVTVAPQTPITPSNANVAPSAPIVQPAPAAPEKNPIPAPVLTGNWNNTPPAQSAGAQFVPAPAVAPAQPAPQSVPLAAMDQVRICANGHVVSDPSAHFCAQCGAPIQAPAHQGM